MQRPYKLGVLLSGSGTSLSRCACDFLAALIEGRIWYAAQVANILRIKSLSFAGLLFVALLATAAVSPSQAPSQSQQPAAAAPQSPAAPPIVSPPALGAAATPSGAPVQQGLLNVVVLDPAHGGTDPGARGTGGIRESEIVLSFAREVRRALEQQGFQVVQTRQGNEDPSFDDRSATANAQRGAVFVTLHISSTVST
jgi:N-acetylmuramoyl-L-alanine amidase